MEAVKPQELIAEFKGVYDNECDKTELIDQNGLTEVKICGITSMADVNLLIKYGADYGGWTLPNPIIWIGSRRIWIPKPIWARSVRCAMLIR